MDSIKIDDDGLLHFEISRLGEVQVCEIDVLEALDSLLRLEKKHSRDDISEVNAAGEYTRMPFDHVDFWRELASEFVRLGIDRCTLKVASSIRDAVLGHFDDAKKNSGGTDSLQKSSDSTPSS